MSRFTGLLTRAAGKLEIPQPARSRVLLELAGDLNDLYEHYRGEGLDEAEAARKVEERFEVSDEVLSQLVRLHHSAFRRWIDRFSEQAQARWERTVLAAVVLFVAVVSATQLVSSAFFREASGFVWVVAAIAVVAIALSLAKSYQLFVKKDHRPDQLRRGLPALLFLGCASCFTGIFGSVAGMYVTMARIAAGSERPGEQSIDGLLGSSATMIASFLVGLLCALIWFLLMSKVRRIELAEAALLLEAPS
jgi:hypothetical protein